MRKYLLALALLLLLSTYVTIQNQEYAEGATSNTAPPLQTSSPSANEQAEGNPSHSKRHAPSWYRIFVWPEGISVWAILATLVVIAEQTDATRKSSESAKDSADAALKQARLQEIVMKQWVEIYLDHIKEHSVEQDAMGTPLPSSHIDLVFEVANRTQYPLTLTGVYIALDRTIFTTPRELTIFEESWNITVPPKTGHAFAASLLLSTAELQDFRKSKFYLSMLGNVVFRPAVGSEELHQFRLAYECGQSGHLRTIPMISNLPKSTNRTLHPQP